MKLKFSRFQRLLARREFRDLYREGQKYVGKSLLIFYHLDRFTNSKLGITITKKWGKAHDRNRFKRVVREGFRKVYPKMEQGVILNVQPREGYKNLTPQQIEIELKRLIERFGQTESESTKSCCHH